MGVKDQFDIKGHRNTGGCHAYGDNIAREDSTIIARFREAGAVILGTLATHEFHMGGTLEFYNKHTPRNPWDLDKSPAGSSAGSGAAVAAGLLSGAMGGGYRRLHPGSGFGQRDHRVAPKLGSAEPPGDIHAGLGT